MPQKGVRKCLSCRCQKHPSPQATREISQKRKRWREEQMIAALKAVESDAGVNKVAREHGIPASTLKDRV